MPHLARIPVRWSDLDALGHVNNAAYLTYCEQARIDVLTAIAPEWWTDEQGPVVAQASIRYRRPIRATGTVLVEVGFETPGRSSLGTTYRLALASDPATTVAEADALLVWVDAATGRPTPLPEALREALARAAETPTGAPARSRDGAR